MPRAALVYAGGDDVLAFLPLPEALSCAEDLHKSLTGAMASACKSIPDGQRPTLSVGLGIGHVMESMGDLLALRRQAEREAKRERNSLAVVVDKRSGGTRNWYARWSADPVSTLRDATALLRDRLPSRKVYEIAVNDLGAPISCEAACAQPSPPFSGSAIAASFCYTISRPRAYPASKGQLGTTSRGGCASSTPMPT